MVPKTRLKVVFLWHMHQPEYRDLISGIYQLPWTYLHATKDYADMAALLEQHPGARAVVNFAPVLLDQIGDYAAQLRGFLGNSGAIRDPLLAALGEAALPVRGEERLTLIHACLRANEERLIKPYPAYKRLAEMANWCKDKPEMIPYLGEQFLADILVWYHLAWLGETVRRADGRVRRLLDKGQGYTLHDRRELLEVIEGLLSGLIGRYRALAQAGRVELAMNPYAHPIMPLLLDLKSAREAMPEAMLPSIEAYPGGEARARWHLREGLAAFEKHFGFRPAGCWPSEGGLSDAALALFAEHGFRWTASGENVLTNSLRGAGVDTSAARANWLFRPYRIEGRDGISCFFRDDGLSDLIGFKYADWHGDDAAANLVHNLENIARAVKGNRDAVVSVILDGENAWEYYPNNGYYFLSALYRLLADHPLIEMTTYSACLDQGIKAARLPRLVAGSWVYGTFSTWIGDRDKNRAWDMLGAAKKMYDQAVASGRLKGQALEAATRQLAACEGSDWCWWFGDYNPATTVSDFERLYRVHLANLYQMMGVEPPEQLARVVSHGGGAPARGGTMRPGQTG